MSINFAMGKIMDMPDGEKSSESEDDEEKKEEKDQIKSPN